MNLYSTTAPVLPPSPQANYKTIKLSIYHIKTLHKACTYIIHVSKITHTQNMEIATFKLEKSDKFLCTRETRDVYATILWHKLFSRRHVSYEFRVGT